MKTKSRRKDRPSDRSMNTYEHAFQCPLANGLHARPASRLADVATRFTSEITLTNERTEAVGNAKSVLALVAMDVRRGDGCRVRIQGADAQPAHAAMREFLSNVMPVCDEPVPAASVESEVQLPRSLKKVISTPHVGTPVCAGIGQGAVVIVGGLALPAELATDPASSIEDERRNVRTAAAAVRASLEGRLATRPGEVEAGVLRAHLSIVGDVALHDCIDTCIAKGRQSAAYAIVEAGRVFAARLGAAESAYIRERAIDVEDICMQLLEHIGGNGSRVGEIKLSGPSVIAAENLTPRQLLGLDKRLVAALVLGHIGTTSHTVILARSFNIPTITGVSDVRTRLPAGAEVIVDANIGVVIPDVTDAVRRYYDRERRKYALRRERFAQYISPPAKTRDGHRIDVGANVATIDELPGALELGAAGIGLFRTEMLFMDRDGAPSDEEQFKVYVQAARAAAGRDVIFRTIDIGGDKPLRYLNLPEEANPFLGYRGVRIYPDHRAVIMSQLRAIVRASAFGRVWMMVPMICSVEEVRWIKTCIAEIQAELRSKNIAFDAKMPIGVMVEVPAVAFIIDQLAAEVDFFSIGTNDLMQHFLAVDRTSDKVAGLYSPLHPAFLRLLDKIVADVHRHGRWIGMCGEMTRSPRNLPLLIGLGLDEISTAAAEIPALKAAIAELSADQCRRTLAEAMNARTIAEVDAVLDSYHDLGAAHRMIEPGFVILDAEIEGKEEAIKEMIDAFYAGGRTDTPFTLEAAVWAREQLCSTGLGHGFAIPHCKTDAINSDTIGLIRFRNDVEWQSIDGRPVRCMILLATRATQTNGTHMQVFSKLARKLMNDDFRNRLLAAPDRDAILAFLAEELGLSAN